MTKIIRLFSNLTKKIIYFFKFIRNMLYGYENMNIPNYLLNAMNEDKLIEFFLAIILLLLVIKYFS